MLWLNYILGEPVICIWPTFTKIIRELLVLRHIAVLITAHVAILYELILFRMGRGAKLTTSYDRNPNRKPKIYNQLHTGKHVPV